MNERNIEERMCRLIEQLQTLPTEYKDKLEKLCQKDKDQRSKIEDTVSKLQDAIADETAFHALILAFNYGFKNEVIAAFKKGYDEVESKKNLQDINIKNLFYLGEIPDPDILIRTGGFKRLSNYLMYNLCYTELFFTKTLWPDFTKKELEKIIKEFKKITRNYGL